MIYIKLKGGLGNQMFQYAFGKAISQHYNEPLLLDVSSYYKDKKREYALNRYNINAQVFHDVSMYDKFIRHNLSGKIAHKISKTLNIFNNTYYEKSSFIYDANVFNTRLKKFDGYWQSYKYFNNLRDILIDEFIPIVSFSNKDINILEEIKSTNSIAIHIRRGDYRFDKKSSLKHGCLDISYFYDAINILERESNNNKYYIFSDEIDYVKNELSLSDSSIQFVTSSTLHADSIELYLMTQCKSVIISNSTYSWWAAFLNTNQNIICPNNWFINDNVNINNLYPSHWQKI